MPLGGGCSEWDPADDVPEDRLRVVTAFGDGLSRSDAALAHRDEPQRSCCGAEFRDGPGKVFAVGLADPPFGDARAVCDLFDGGGLQIPGAGERHAVPDDVEQHTERLGEVGSLVGGDIGPTGSGRMRKRVAQAACAAVPCQLEQRREFLDDRDRLRGDGGDELVRLIDVEGVGMPAVGQPGASFLGAVEHLGSECVVVVVAHPIGEFAVAPDAAAVLWWAGELPADAYRDRASAVEHLLDAQDMRPAIAEVVVIPEPVALISDDLVEAHIVFEHPLVALVEVELGEELGSVAVIARAEAVQVAVGPSHRRLDHLVQPREEDVAGNLDASPHRRLRALQVDTDTEAPHRSGDGEELRLGTTPEIVQMIGVGPQRGDELLKIRCLELLGCHLPSPDLRAHHFGMRHRDQFSRSTSVFAQLLVREVPGGAHRTPPDGSRHDRMKQSPSCRR